MQTTPQPSLPPERDPTNREYRRVLAGFTALLVIGLLTAALWPGGSSQTLQPVVPAPTEQATAEPATPPGAAPQPSPEPAAPPGAAPQPQAPLPDLPAEEPSLLVAHGDRACPQIALTYDAGSGADGAAAILDVLKKHGVVSTFFLTGKWVERYPDLARRIAAEGHEIANHTYSHPDLTKLTPEEALREIEQGAEAIRTITGRESRPLFREPYGAFNEAERRLVRKAGFSYSIYWDVDTLDWQFPSVETLTERITGKSRSGSVVLMHLNVPATATASDQAIPLLRAKGYALVTVTQALKCP